MGLVINKLPDPRTVKILADRMIDAENELAKVRAEWAALFAGTAEDEGGKGTLSDRIVALIQSRFEVTFTQPMVSQMLNANPNSVGPLLSRLVAEHKIRKVGHGEYRGTTPDPEWWGKSPRVTEETKTESPSALES